MSWAAYPQYKESKTSVLDDVPSGWVVLRLSRVLAGIKDGTHGTFVRTGEGFSLLSAKNVHDDGLRITDDESLISRDDYLDITRVGYPVKGDVLLTIVGTIGRVCVFDQDEPVAFQRSVCFLRPGPMCSPAFLANIARSIPFQNQLQLAAKTAAQSGVYMGDVAACIVALPPISEQAAICQFLDRETAKIDALIAKHEQLIGTLSEDRNATITHAVTQGLDPAVDFVHPHNAELPACPKHWTLQVSLKRLAQVQTGLTLGKSVDPVEAVVVPYLRVANVQTRGVNLDEVKTVAVVRSELSKYLLRDGDVLMTEGGDIDKLGRGCVWSGEISPCIHQNHVFAVRCMDSLSNEFLVFLLDTAVARNYFFMTAKKTTNLASTNSTTLGAFTFSLPPRAEQDEIVEYLNERCAGLDALVTKANAVIKVLREYRAALITDAVTGKIDVRGAVA